MAERKADIIIVLASSSLPHKTSNDREPEGWPVVACTI
jgi:hypothetical protein